LRSDGRQLHTVGPETEKVHPPSFVFDLTATADLVVESEPAHGGVKLSKRNEVLKECWTATAKTACIRVTALNNILQY